MAWLYIIVFLLFVLGVGIAIYEKRTGKTLMKHDFNGEDKRHLLLREYLKPEWGHYLIYAIAGVAGLAFTIWLVS